MRNLDHLQTPSPILRPYAFDRVEVCGHYLDGKPISFSILGVCWSQFDSGPNLMTLADAASDLVGSGSFGLKGARSLGFRYGGQK